MSLKSSLDSYSSRVRILNRLLNPETPQRPLVRRGDHFVGPFFSGGLSPVETILGESQGSGRRIGLTHDLRNWILPLGRSMEQRGSQNRLPQFRIRACSAPIPLKTSETLDRTPLLNATSSAARSSDRFLAFVAVPSHLRRIPPQQLLTGGASVVLGSPVGFLLRKIR
jgi:hypothetical protein